MFDYKRITELSIEESKAIPKLYLEEQICLHCGTAYKEKDNLGQLGCRIHPGILSYDSEKNITNYTCCKSLAGQSSGCLRSDHSSQRRSITDQEERLNAITQFSTAIVPTDFYRYGIRPPLLQNILFHRRPRQLIRGKSQSIVFELPPPVEIKRVHHPEEEYTVLRKRWRTFPLLVHYQKSLETGCNSVGGQGEKCRRFRIERGWRRTLWEDPVVSDEEEEDDGNSTNNDKIDIPFVIIKRIGSTPL